MSFLTSCPCIGATFCFAVTARRFVFAHLGGEARSTRVSRRHNSPLWKLLQLFDALLGDLHVVGGEDVDDLLQRFEDVVVRCLLLLHHLQELHLPEQYSLYVSLAIKVSFAVQDKDKYSKIYIVDIRITAVPCKLEKMN